MKKILIPVLLVCLVLLAVAPTFAGGAPSVYINGYKLDSGNAVAVENDRVLVSLDSLLKGFNLQGSFNPADQSVSVGKIWMKADNFKAWVGDKQVALDVPARVLGGVTYVPLRFFAENLKKYVSWNKAENRMDIREIPIFIKDLKVKANGINFHVVDYGGTGDTIILVHGLTNNCRIWDAVAEKLVDQYRVIAFDLRGRGDSDKPRDDSYNYWQYVEDLKGIIDYFGVDRAIVMGHSLGAGIGVCFASKYPERLSRLVLVDGGADPDPRLFEALRPSLISLGKIYPDHQAYINGNRTSPMYSDWNDYMDRYFYYNVNHLPDGTVVTKAAKEILTSTVKVSLNQLHDKVQTPTLILKSQLGVANIPVITKEKCEELAGKINGSRYVEIQGSNHATIVLKVFPQFEREVKDFLSSR